MIEEILKKNNLKITNHRIEVFNIIQKLEIEATLDNIYKNLKIDKVTIYRIIKLYLKYNIINKNINGNNIYYTINSKEHSHYINCIICGKKEKIDFSFIDDSINKVCKQNNFELLSHSINLEGICNECKILKKIQ